jgi:hypothetical protein
MLLVVTAVVIEFVIGSPVIAKLVDLSTVSIFVATVLLFALFLVQSMLIRVVMSL